MSTGATATSDARVEVAREGIQQIRLIHFSILAVSATVGYLCLRAMSVPRTAVEEAHQLQQALAPSSPVAQMERLRADEVRLLSDAFRRTIAARLNRPIGLDSTDPDGARARIMRLYDVQPMQPSLEWPDARLSHVRTALESAQWHISVPIRVEVDTTDERLQAMLADTSVDIELRDVDVLARPENGHVGRATLDLVAVTYALRDERELSSATHFRTPCEFELTEGHVPALGQLFETAYPGLAGAWTDLRRTPLRELEDAAARLHRTELREETPEVVGVKIQAEHLAIVAPGAICIMLAYLLFHTHRLHSLANGEPLFTAHEPHWIGCASHWMGRFLAFVSVVVVPVAAAALPGIAIDHSWPMASLPAVSAFPLAVGSLAFGQFLVGRRVSAGNTVAPVSRAVDALETEVARAQIEQQLSRVRADIVFSMELETEEEIEAEIDRRLPGVRRLLETWRS